MARNIRLPNTQNTAVLKAEPELVVPLLTAAAVLPAGGGPAGGLGFWKKAFPASVYSQFVIEIQGTTQMTLNDGTINSGIGLYGDYVNSAGATIRQLIGVVGYNLGALMPQVRIHSATNGFAQLVNIASVYTSIALGGIFANIVVPGVGPTVTATARPIIERDYAG